MAVAEVDPNRTRGEVPEDEAGRMPATGWRMPGGEDLLNFALSAGLAAGVWWMEHREEGTAAGAAPKKAAGGARLEESR
ncbi:MAG: hypothetical protein N2036_14170 [Bryobacteraceae bacterium]|nr:hypothetical protein [Bryobacteraceae bacterium]MCX7605220.1 hypothetical protein [Bryobacteraceae bacterium]